MDKNDFLKNHHQQGALLNDPDQNVEIIFGKNNNYHQSGNSYFEFDITVRDPTAGFNNNAEIRLVNSGFAYCFKGATISTTGGMKTEQGKFLGQVSTIMRSLTSKNCDLLSYFEKISERDANNISLNDRLFNNHSVVVIRLKIKGQLPLEHICGFCKTLER